MQSMAKTFSVVVQESGVCAPLTSRTYSHANKTNEVSSRGVAMGKVDESLTIKDDHAHSKLHFGINHVGQLRQTVDLHARIVKYI